LVPSFIEYIFSFFTNKWNPRVSLLIGVSSWILCYVFFLKILFKIFKLNNISKQILSLFISICFFSSPFFFYRFTLVFAIHKVLPVLCSICISLIIFKKSHDYIISYKDIFSLITLILVGQFSFVSGIFLWPNTIIFLLLKKYINNKSISKYKLFLLGIISTISLLGYLNLFNQSHIIELTKNNYVSFLNNWDIFLRIFKYFTFLSTFSSSYFNGLTFFGSDLYIFFSCINFLLIITIVFLKFESIRNFLNKKCIFDVAPLLYLITFNLYGFLAVLISRKPVSLENRYFCESTIFSLSLLFLFFYLLINLKKIRLINIYIVSVLVLCFSNLISNLIFTKNYVFLPSKRDYVGDRKIIECIKKSDFPTYEYLIDTCNLNKNWLFIQKGNKKYHPIIKISDYDEYSGKIYKVFGNKKSPTNKTN